jgi:DNA-binding MarR family transcriptional regulator
MSTLLVDLELGRNACGRLLRRELAEFGIDPREAVLLRLLAVNGPTTLFVLRRSTAMPASTIASVAKRLVADGLVIRFRTYADRRYGWLELTAAGRQAAAMVTSTLTDISATLDQLPVPPEDSIAGVAAALYEVTVASWRWGLG